ncbi:uncharacterized protein LOC115752376 [Rhodamnia argentea]|uniref:Uncharacterized protein LOC115752376 n=1 Tax=Rhodamnia argentea TaxID=178133 RepID=A0A8B8QJI0_9MYRT|nr:uncharacterized protein LOC115752376 [Rhodamnia argentea]
MKNASRIKFLHCFRRPVVNEVLLEPGRRRTQLMHLLMEEEDNEKASAKSPYARSRKPSFSRMLKSALFDNALARSIRRKRSSSLRNSLLTNRYHPTDAEPRGSLRDNNDQKLIDDQTNCFSSTSPSSSSCSSSALEHGDCVSKPWSHGGFSYNVSSTKQERSPDRQDQSPRTKRAKLHMAYLLLISLTGTVLCGRAYAIAFASMWLLVVTRRLLRSSVMDSADDVRTIIEKRVKVSQVETGEKKRRKTVAQLIVEVLGRMRGRNRRQK